MANIMFLNVTMC